jgi:isopenicillin N synthase-like dioxygenase
MMPKDFSARDLEKRGVVDVAYPNDLRAAVEKAVASWKQFCGEDETVKKRFPYNKELGGIGYELQNTAGDTLDRKEDFHFTLASRSWLMQTADTIGNASISDFLKNVEGLVNLMEPLVLNFAERVEKEFILPDFKASVSASKNDWIVRFLHYFGDRQEGDQIGSPHPDKSPFTLHLYESDPGLQYLDFEKNWQEMPVSSGETAIIPGMGLQYLSKSQLKAIYHRVVATRDTAQRGRFSAVCFVQAKGIPAYDKQKNGRLQDFPIGFNYTLAQEEFSRLFVPPSR